ncbi:MAG: serine/threonine protein kinase [Phycisphaerales bacterium]|nr:serine/threonine protein kinase [Phycisphaerales bacterium]
MSFPSASRLIGLLLDESESDQAAGLPEIDGYFVDRQLGRGGGGEVFLAFRERGGEALAVKLLGNSMGTNAKADKRAWRELDVLMELRVPGVLPVQDYGIADGRLYIATAHVEGLALDDHCEQNQLDLRERVELLSRVADVVQGFHEHGVIHRDLKPSNIIVRHDGHPVVIDFGIASLLDQDSADTLTSTGSPIGTLGFMSPEQARGEKQHFSTRTDVYGLGAIACLVLTGKTPHDVDTAMHEAIRRVAQDAPRNPLDLNPALPKPLAQIIVRATASNPLERYASAALFAEDLRRWLRNEPIAWQKTRWWTRQLLAWRRNPKAFIAKAAIWFLLLTTFVTSTLAVAQWQVAEQERLNTATAQQIADDKAALAALEESRKQLWQEKAKQLEEFHQGTLEREKRLQERRKKQIEVVQLAKEQGELFQASIVLLTLGEEIQAENFSDQELVNRFVTLLHELIEKARTHAPEN